MCFGRLDLKNDIPKVGIEMFSAFNWDLIDCKGINVTPSNTILLYEIAIKSL
jgi:hypothetical protein